MLLSLFLGYETLHRFGIDGLAAVPVVLHVVDVEREVFNTVGRGFVKVFVLIGVLFLSTFLIKKLFILRVVMLVIFTLCHLRPVIPRCYVSIFR